MFNISFSQAHEMLLSKPFLVFEVILMLFKYLNSIFLNSVPTETFSFPASQQPQLKQFTTSRTLFVKQELESDEVMVLSFDV